MMKEELTKKLFDDFPRLFKGRNYSIQTNLMPFGCECGDGWFDLIYKLSSDLEAEFQKLAEADKAEALENDYYIAVQVKEKFGGLRFYLSATTDEMDALVDKAEEDSFKICEVCGKPGEPRGGGWISTLCDEHKKK